MWVQIAQGNNAPLRPTRFPILVVFDGRDSHCRECSAYHRTNVFVLFLSDSGPRWEVFEVKVFLIVRRFPCFVVDGG